MKRGEVFGKRDYLKMQGLNGQFPMEKDIQRVAAAWSTEFVPGDAACRAQPNGYGFDRYGPIVPAQPGGMRWPASSHDGNKEALGVALTHSSSGYKAGAMPGNTTTDEAVIREASRKPAADPLGKDKRCVALTRVQLPRSILEAAVHTHNQAMAAARKAPSPPGKNKRAPKKRLDRTTLASTQRHGLNLSRLKLFAKRLSSATASEPKIPISVRRSERRRAASLLSATQQLPLKHQVARLQGIPGIGLPLLGIDHGGRPRCDQLFDKAFLDRATLELQRQTKRRSNSRAIETARGLLPILESCKFPVTDGEIEAIEAHLLSGHQAKSLLEYTSPDVPIITEQQQHFQWDNPDRPIPEFFDWIEDHERTVSVQIPSLKADQLSYKIRSIRQVRDRFLSSGTCKDPWNILDCSCPMPSTLPAFLSGRNSQLLARIREKVLNGASAERAVAHRDEWAEWRDIEHWVLLSEGGHCTAAHMDSHGLATWITVQEGLFGFAWMSRPTEAQRTAWMTDPDHFDEDQPWRYWVLKPGQTVFFPSGTIHAVFRVGQGQTLALGGHVLQWTGIERWANVVSRQVEAPDSTNEDMTDIGKWIPVLEELVRKKLERIANATG